MGKLLERIPEIEHPEFDRVYFKSAEIDGDKEKDYSEFGKEVKSIYNEGFFLDIACGIGKFAYALAKENISSHVIGLDSNQEAIDIVNKILEEKPLENIEYINGNVYDLSKFYSKMDLVTCIVSLHHFNDLKKALSQIYKSLKDDGLFYFSDLNREYLLDIDRGISLPGGIIIGEGEYIYHARSKGKDDFFIKCFLENKIFASDNAYENKIRILTLNSYIAAYTPAEIQAALIETGFSDIRMKLSDRKDSFSGFAVK